MPTTPSVVLRPVEDGDVEIFFEHQSDPVASEMAAFPIRDHLAHLRHWAMRMSEPSITVLTIVSEGEIAGNIFKWDQDGRPEVGYWLGRDHWGRGVATAALDQFLDVVGARPLYASVATGNAGSQRVLEKCGFRATGRVIEDENADLLEYVLV